MKSSIKRRAGLGSTLKLPTRLEQLALLKRHGVQDVLIDGSTAFIFWGRESEVAQPQQFVPLQLTYHAPPPSTWRLADTAHDQHHLRSYGHVEPMPTGDGGRCVPLSWTELQDWARRTGIKRIHVHEPSDLGPDHLTMAQVFDLPPVGINLDLGPALALGSDRLRRRPLVGARSKPPPEVSGYAPIERVGDDTTVVGMGTACASSNKGDFDNAALHRSFH